MHIEEWHRCNTFTPLNPEPLDQAPPAGGVFHSGRTMMIETNGITTQFLTEEQLGRLSQTYATDSPNSLHVAAAGSANMMATLASS